MKDFINKINQTAAYLQNDVLDDVGVQARQHFKDSFHKEAFSDKKEKDMKWQEVKRRKEGGKRAAQNRKILTGETGDLGESINYKKQQRSLLFTSDKIYADVHNRGLKAGRGAGFIMPKRQFIGPSALLQTKITTKITTRINSIMRQ